MQMYASAAGKSGGEYYTPQEVSELLARITVVGKTEVNKVYDPACGSGSMLLKFEKVLGHGQGPAGLLRPGGQPDHLQPVPDQHVPARHHLREVRHRPRRHPDRPGALGRRAVRGDRVQPAVLDQVGRRRQPAAHQRPALRARGRARAEVEGRPGLHDAHPQLARRQRHRGDRRVPRRALPRRRRAEDPQVPRRQQLRRRRHPAPAGPVLRYDDRHLRHRAQEVQGRQQDPVHRRAPRCSAGRATRTSSRPSTSRRSSTPSPAARTCRTSRRWSTTR